MHKDQETVTVSFVDDKSVGQMADDYLVRHELIPEKAYGRFGPRDPVTGVRVRTLTVVARPDV